MSEMLDKIREVLGFCVAAQNTVDQTALMVLEALREPTPDMLAIDNDGYCPACGYDGLPSDCSKVWAKMIEAALK